MHRVATAMFALALVAAPARAGQQGIVIGEVSSKVARSGFDYESLVRSASEEELLALDLARFRIQSPIIVSVSLVKLETQAERRTMDARCHVSATLRRAKGGAIFAVLEASARASSTDTRDAVESSAVHGAVHGALARLPEVLAAR